MHFLIAAVALAVLALAIAALFLPMEEDMRDYDQ